jgi:hypothetical protein
MEIEPKTASQPSQSLQIAKSPNPPGADQMNQILSTTIIRKRLSGLLLIFLFALIFGAPWTSRLLSAQDVEHPSDPALFFDEAHDALENALQLFEEQDQLPESDELPFYDYFSRTRETQQQMVEEYLDVAAEALGISRINERRERITDLRKEISQSRASIASWERNRISAPERSYNPLTVSRGGYDKKIKREKARIEQAESQIAAEKDRLVQQLNHIGMKISPENVDVLLESITGDEFVRVSIIFENARSFARELEQLTEQSGEDLTIARQYYGIYLMLLRSIDRLQLKFIEKVDSEYYPRLNQYMEQARSNISNARRAINQGGDREILENNIYNNEITLDAATFYKQSLSQQKFEMMKANERIKTNILTATNTYQTATLSRNLASLIAISRRAFDSITSLSPPDLRPFENTKLKEEFSRLAREIRSDR